MASSLSDPKLGESFLTDLQLSAPTPCKQRAPHSPRRRGTYEFDGNEPARDIQSDLFLLDQAMQANPPARAEHLLPSAPLPSTDLDTSDALFGASGFPPPLFDDTSKLLCLEAVTGAAPTSGPFSSTTMTHSLPVTSSLAVASAKGDFGGTEPSEFDMMHQFGLITPQPDRDLNYAKDLTYSSFQLDTTNSGYSHHPYNVETEVITPGSTTFGRQKKRRLSDTGYLYEDPVTLSKRLKSDMGLSNAYHPLEALGERATFGSSLGDSSGCLETSRSYSLHTSGYNESTTAPLAHSELYNSLSPDMQQKVDHLREKIAKMPRRKLRKSLTKGVTIEEVMPLMSLNRDDLAEMLGLGVTTWKIFIHNTFGIPRWPARVLKSQELREKGLQNRLNDAELRGDTAAAADLLQELRKLEDKRRKMRNKIRSIAGTCREKLMGGDRRKNGASK